MADMKTKIDDKMAEKFKDVGIRRTADDEKPMITLPEGMEYDHAIFWMGKLRDEENKEVSIDHRFEGYYPPDAALALTKAIERTYGFVSQEGTPAFWSIIPPATIGVESSLDTIVQIPWGRMTFHGIGGYVDTGIAFVDGYPVMRLAGLVRKGDKSKIEKLVQLTKEILKTESIYRGKAVKIDFSNFAPNDPRFDAMKAPKFFDTTKTPLEALILSKDVYEAVDANLFTPIRFTEACRKAGIPLRRGILIAGPFGTGKTLTALATAGLAEKNGWTFIYLTNLTQLPQALQFAKNYSPAVVFGEDIDRVLDGERDAEMDKYLNSMDGVDRKNHEVMVVFTTNNVESIHPAMMRPGRIDAIIPIEPPDAEAMIRLLKHYGMGLIDPNADLHSVGKLLAGQIPAAAREVIDRSKLRAVRDSEDGKVVLTENHLMQAGVEMLKHVEYLKEDEEDTRDPLSVLGDAIGNRIGTALRGGYDEKLDLAAQAGLGKVIAEAAGNGKSPD